MKKLILTMALAIMGISQMFAISTSTIRNHARFLSDRMAYELDLTPRQYDDVYEINYDFIYWSSRIMNDVVYGYEDAIDQYYDLLDDRNDDLHYVLSGSQYRRFLDCSYFYRPIYTNGRNWSFRIYTVYRNHNFFYYDAPSHYKNYAGAHCRRTYGRPTYYSSRYEGIHRDRHNDNNFRLKAHASRKDFQRNDFGGDVRKRNDVEKNKVNNYKNPNSPRRTENKYYKDNSGNKYSPDINRRDSGNRPVATGSRTDSSKGASAGNRSNTNTGRGSNATPAKSNTSTSKSGSSTRGGNGGAGSNSTTRQPVRK